MADTKTAEPKPGTSVNTMDQTEYQKAQAEQAKANKAAAEQQAGEPPAAPTPTQEEADAMKQVALGQAPEVNPEAKKREAKAEPQPGEAGYKTR